MLHGFYQVFGELFAPIKNILFKKFKVSENCLGYNIFRRITTFLLIMLAWIIFRANSLRNGLSMIISMITVWNPWILTNDALYSLGLSWKEVHVLVLCLIILMIVSTIQEHGINIRDCILKQNIILRWIIYIGAILFITIFGTYGYGFDAQAFIYGGF